MDKECAGGCWSQQVLSTTWDRCRGGGEDVAGGTVEPGAPRRQWRSGYIYKYPGAVKKSYLNPCPMLPLHFSNFVDNTSQPRDELPFSKENH